MAGERSDGERQPRPPPPPEIARRIRFPLVQLIGVPILALIPILSMADVFGERWETREGASAHLRVRVDFPSRLRAKLSRPMVIQVESRSTATLDTIEVELDPAYVERFASVAFTPLAREAYVVPLIAVHPGETRHVHMEIEGELIGRHRGRVVARTGADSAVVPIQSIVFP